MCLSCFQIGSLQPCKASLRKSRALLLFSAPHGVTARNEESVFEETKRGGGNAYVTIPDIR